MRRMVFTTAHREMILATPPSKTETRRLWKRPMLHPGDEFVPCTNRFDIKTDFGVLRAVDVWQESLADSMLKGAWRPEGYDSSAAFLEVFWKINERKLQHPPQAAPWLTEPVVFPSYEEFVRGLYLVQPYAIRFEIVQRKKMVRFRKLLEAG